MRITEKQLRHIVRDEVMQSSTIREAAAAPAAGGTVDYVVKKGDTISGILNKQYGIALSKSNYPIYNQIAKAAGLASADMVPAPNTVLKLPATLAGKPRIGGGPGAPAAGAPAAAKGKQCELPTYKDSIGQALAKIGVTGVAASATLDVIIFGKFYNMTADALLKAANTLRTFGSTGVQAAIGSITSAVTGGGSELVKNVLIGFFDFFYRLLANSTNAKIKFSRTCDYATYCKEMGSAFGQAVGAFVEDVKEGIQAAVQHMMTANQVVAKLLADAGLAALGITAGVISGIITGIAKLISMGAQAVQAVVSAEMIAAGKVIQAGGQVLSAAGGAAQRAGGAVAATGQALSESRKLQNERLQRLADDMLHAARVNHYLAQMHPDARSMITI